MDNAMNAVNKLFANGNGQANAQPSDQPNGDNVTNSQSKYSGATGANGDVDETVDSKVAPAVEHKHVKKQHETREQTVLHKEKHQDHYHTTVQPLKDTEVRPEKHDYTQETKNRSVNQDDGSSKAKAEADRAKFENTNDQKQFESKTKEATQGEEHVHHHLHETIQPVIEKDVIDPSITHKRIDVNERIQEPSQYHSMTRNAAMSAEEFQKKINKEKQ